jgi:hypothetical protein
VIEDKTERRHLDIAKDVEAEWQAVLYTLRVQDFQDAFQKWQKCWWPVVPKLVSD